MIVDIDRLTNDLAFTGCTFAQLGIIPAEVLGWTTIMVNARRPPVTVTIRLTRSRTVTITSTPGHCVPLHVVWAPTPPDATDATPAERPATPPPADETPTAGTTGPPDASTARTEPHGRTLTDPDTGHPVTLTPGAARAVDGMIALLDADLAETTAAFHRVAARYDAERTQARRVRAELHQARADAERQAHIIATAFGDAERALSEADRMRDAEARARREATQKSGDLKQLRAELERNTDAGIAITEQRDQARAALAQARKDIANADAEASQLRRQLADVKAKATSDQAAAERTINRRGERIAVLSQRILDRAPTWSGAAADQVIARQRETIYQILALVESNEDLWRQAVGIATRD
jgi:hypothetical protein